jgi:hypothetical protein
MPHASQWIRTAGPRVLITAGLILSSAACAAGGTPQSQVTPTPPQSATTSPDPTSSPPGPSQTGSPAPPPTGSGLSRVTVIRSGGIAGVMQSVRVDADGSWVYVDRRTGAPKSGKLSDAQRRQLTSLIAAPAFAREARMPPSAGVCNDGFIYAISVGDMTARYDDCASSGRQPTLEAVVNLLVDATAL